MRYRRNKPLAPSTLVALALVMSMGASVEVVSAAAVTRSVGPRTDEKQVAELLATFTQAAKQLGGRTTDFSIASRTTSPTTCLAAALVEIAPIHDDRLPAPAAPVRPHLTDLPPPTDC